MHYTRYKMKSKAAVAQQGAVLVTSLLLLLVMTMLALTGMQNSVLNERMASNWQQRDKAFQVADSSAAEAKANQAHLAAALNAGPNGSDTLSGLSDMNGLSRSVSTTWIQDTTVIGSSTGQATGGSSFTAKHFKTEGVATQTNGINSTVVHGYFQQALAP